MICDHIADSLGFTCSILNEAGTVAHVATPFKFADGDPVPVYLEVTDQHVRFFDDGGVFLHFKGRGLQLGGRNQARFIIKAAERHGAVYSEDWVLQTYGASASVQDAFRTYMNAMHDICAWEMENEGIAQDTAMLVEEAVMAFLAAKPDAEIVREPSFTGVSGKKRTLSLLVDGTAVAVTGTHHAAVSAALMSMVDIRQSAQNQGGKFLFLIEDRNNPERARQDATVLQAAAPVQLMSNLQQAGHPQPALVQ